MNGIEYLQLISNIYPIRDFSKHFREVDNIWSIFEKNGYIKPENLQIALNERDFFHQLFDRAVKASSFNKNNIYFNFIPTKDFNALSKTTSNGDYVILFDEHLYSKLIELIHSFMILANITLFDYERKEIYRFIEHSFATFYKKEITEDEKIEFYPLWRKIMIKDPEVFNWSAITVSVILLFIFSHEIGHCALKHNEREKNIISDEFLNNTFLHKNEYEADIYGFKNILKINSNIKSNTFINIPDDFVNMSIVYFDIMDLYFDWCKFKGIFKIKTHPEPSKRKKKIIKNCKIMETNASLYQNIINEISLYKKSSR